MKQIRSLFLIFALFLGASVSVYAQIGQKDGPPPPTVMAREGPPCPVDEEEGEGVPPPVGLCMPIDDYVYILMAVGVMYGCYRARDFETS